MLNKIVVNPVVLALSALAVAAAPTPDQEGGALVFTNGTNSTLSPHNQQWDTSVFRSCLNTSQVALTFDGEPFLLSERAIAHACHSRWTP